MNTNGNQVFTFDKAGNINAKFVIDAVNEFVEKLTKLPTYLNVYQTPYFHFQAGGVPQYKPQLNPTGEPMAQLLEAVLIAHKTDKQTCYLPFCMAAK